MSISLLIFLTFVGATDCNVTISRFKEEFKLKSEYTQVYVIRRRDCRALFQNTDLLALNSSHYNVILFENARMVEQSFLKEIFGEQESSIIVFSTGFVEKFVRCLNFASNISFMFSYNEGDEIVDYSMQLPMGKN